MNPHHHFNDFAPEDLTDENICNFYDKYPDITLKQLSFVTGRTVQDLKSILMKERNYD